MKRINEELYRTIADKYKECGKIRHTAETCGVSVGTVYAAMKYFNIPKWQKQGASLRQCVLFTDEAAELIRAAMKDRRSFSAIVNECVIRQLGGKELSEAELQYLSALAMVDNDDPK